MQDLSSIVKAYDIRGVVPDQFDPEIARAIGAAFAQLVKSPEIVVAHDMRESSGPLTAAFADGVTSQGTNVIEAGLASTDLLYFASGMLDIPGAMFTASHNPAQYNGLKFCRAGAAPVGQDTGLAEIRDMAQQGVPAYDGKKGTISPRDLLVDYAVYLRSLVDLSNIRPLKVVVDAGNGMAGYTVPAVLGNAKLGGLPLDIVPLYFELDGTFPNHEANPLEPKNLVDLQAKVREVGADIGLAFDGDADRCFVIDENGDVVSPSSITALVAIRELAQNPGATVIHNVIVSKAVPEIIREHGGVPVRWKVGHSLIKAEMARHNAIFGGEHSAHYYFAEFWKADTGMLAAMHVLAALGEQAKPLSALTKEFVRYVASGEINSTVDDQAAKIQEVAAVFDSQEGVQLDYLDGLTVDLPDGRWFNIRPSNTEPLLRLNVEARTQKEMESLRDEMLAIIRR